MKKILLLSLLAACSFRDNNNKAEIIALSQAPDAKCDVATTIQRRIALVVCVLPDKTEAVALWSPAHPFQAFKVKTVEGLKAEAEKPPVVAPPDAGAGSGAAAPTSKK